MKEIINVNIISPKDNWILQKMGLELVKASDIGIDFVNGQTQDMEADINYYINWCYWKILYPELPKSKLDIVFFTHFDDNSKTYLDVLNKADLIICMSLHGEQTLIEYGIPKNKLKVCPFFGVSATRKKKIVIGTSGRNYNTERKNKQEIEQLKKDLDSSMFEFRHSNITDDSFFENIDYFLQASTAEGGSMDMLNAIYTRTPVISRDIGFIYNNSTPSDFIYENYEELLFYLKGIEQDFKNKDEFTKNCTWDNSRDWHLKLFKELI